MRNRSTVAITWMLAVTAGAGCAIKTHKPEPLASSPATAVIEEIKDFQQTLGVEPTNNFLTYSGRTHAINRCYFTSKLDLPSSYAGLQMTGDDEEQCTARADQYDVFFYPVEAVASGDADVTPALAEASTERMLVVVPHEDFHNQQKGTVNRPEVAEAAATLTGFLTASAFAKEKYGPDSTTFTRLRREADLFAEKARIVNAHHMALSHVYDAYRAGWISRSMALAEKDEIFDALRHDCAAITPAPVSFNQCPAAMNNAGLAFDRTYTRHYAFVYDLYVDLHEDPKATIEALKRLVAE